MTIEVARDYYYAATATFSEICRQIALGGIAIVWLLHSPKEGLELNRLDPMLLYALGYLILGLTLDALQYLYKSAAWGILARYREVKNRRQELEFPRSINYPTTILFWLKAGAVLNAFVVIAGYIYYKLL